MSRDHEVKLGKVHEWLRQAGLGGRPGAAGGGPAYRGGAAAEQRRAAPGEGGGPRLAGDGPPGGRPGAWSAPRLRLVQ